MIKLYKKIDNILHYWETWDNGNRTATIHWGAVGLEGENKTIKWGIFSNFIKSVRDEIDQRINDGYSEYDDDDLVYLEIVYDIDGFGTEAELEKRHRLEEKMDEVLGWTGLGHTDGGSIGSGTMEVGCMVVDFDIAKNVIEEKLKNTEFSDYSKIIEIKED